ncbi:MAG TPA: Hsp20/alpha crystallin family protein [Acidimicrobiia bacterium]|nr:Hsp20/alpha crystallin family protein [Acidimicrobiia bacterium]
MLLRYDPFRDFDRFTESVFSGPNRRTWMPMDAYRHGDRVELLFDLPGVAADAVEVGVERNVLTIKAGRSWLPAEGDEVLARERTHGSWTRQIMLGDGLDTDRLEAHYEDGVLHVTIPVAEQAKPRKVEITTGERQQSLDVGQPA